VANERDTFNFAVSGVTDAYGNCLINLDNFQAGINAAWNLVLNIQGNAPEVMVLENGLQIAAASAINGNVNLGPINSYGSVNLQVYVTGALPSTAIVGQASGIASNDPAVLATITGQTSLTLGTVTAYDGATLLADIGAAYPEDLTFPIPTAANPAVTWAVQNWASIEFGIQNLTTSTPNVGGIQGTFRWYQNPNGSRLLGQRSFILDENVGTAILTPPNLGPYLAMVVKRLNTNAWTWNASILASNRIVEDIYGGNFSPYLVEQYAQTQAGNNVSSYYFQTLYGGPVWIVVSGNAANPGALTVTVDNMGTDGLYHTRTVAGFSVAAGSVTAIPIVVPQASCRITVTTAAGGSSTYSVVAYSSVTGSS
jgi:hypothetical protein